jgi:hypothetical protein
MKSVLCDINYQTGDWSIQIHEDVLYKNHHLLDVYHKCVMTTQSQCVDMLHENTTW